MFLSSSSSFSSLFLKNNYIEFSFCLSIHSFFYIEGNYVLIGGHLGLIKKKINFFSFLWYSFFFEGNYFFFFSSPFSFFFFYFSPYFFSEKEKQLIKEDILGVSFGYFKKFKFESRLYNVRVVSVFTKWQLAISPKVYFSLPVGIFIKKIKKKSGKRWWAVKGINKQLVLKESFLYKSFRFPDLYSKIGIFLLNDPYEWRNTLKRTR